MPSLSQFVWSGEASYKYGHEGAAPEIEITDAPEDADFTRAGMAHGDDKYSFYCFQGNSKDTLYSFAYDCDCGGYVYSGNELTLVDAPEDIDLSQFDVLQAESTRFHFKRLGSSKATQLYQFILDGSEIKYGHCDDQPIIDVVQFPIDSDRNRWFLYHDGTNHVYGCGIVGSNDKFYSGAFNGEAYQFGHHSCAELTLEDAPDGLVPNVMTMLNDGAAYRFYFVKA